MHYFEFMTLPGGVVAMMAAASFVIVLVSATGSIVSLTKKSGLRAASYSWQQLKALVHLLPVRKEVWGVVYDAQTKRPIPFAKIQLLDRNKRVLESRIADGNGRYGFLTTPETMMNRNIEVSLVASAKGYRFPSRTAPSVDTLVYNNLYYGERITSNELKLINFDIPMDPQEPRDIPLVVASPSIALGASVAAVADAGFWLGLVMVPLNFILNPNPFTLGLVFLFLGTASLRIWGISEHPFGAVIDAHTGRPMPFALMTLNDLSGRRVAFTVTDERGRYFLVVRKGGYDLNIYTPASIQPARHLKRTINARNGWVTMSFTL